MTVKEMMMMMMAMTPTHSIVSQPLAKIADYSSQPCLPSKPIESRVGIPE